jgi:hypothetical protein
MALALEFEEGLAVAVGREVIEDRDAFGLLLEREVTHVRDEDDEFFLVVGAAESLGGGFDDDDAGVGGGLFGEGAGTVGVAIVGDVDPAAIFDVGGGGLRRADLMLEVGHGFSLDCEGEWTVETLF